MEIGKYIDKQLIYNLLDKNYESIIFKIHNNEYSNFYCNFSLKSNRYQVETFKNAIKLNHNCKSILIYNFKNVSIYYNFIEFISYLITKCKNITNFVIKNSSLFDYMNNNHNIINDLSDIIKHSSLKKLLLKNNNLINVNPIFETLRNNNTLEILNLSFNRINDVSILIDVLQNNHTIKIIDLSYNNINNLTSKDNLIKRYPNIKFIF